MIAGKRCCCVLPWVAMIVLAGPGCGLKDSRKLAGRASPSASEMPLPDDPGVVDADEPVIHPDTHMAAGRFHETQGRLLDAAEQYRTAANVKPNHTEALNRLGIVLDRLGKFREADEAFSRAIAAAPNEAHLRNNLAFSYIMQGRWAEAEAELSRALEIHREFTRARVNLGIVLAQQERFEEAMTQFQAVLPLEDAYYNMGLMYQSKRRLVEAAAAYKSALEAAPGMVAAQARLDRLPPEVVTAAEPDGALTASPVPADGEASGAAGRTERPTTYPTTDGSVATQEPAEAAGFDWQWPWQEQKVSEPASAPTVDASGPADSPPELSVAGRDAGLLFDDYLPTDDWNVAAELDDFVGPPPQAPGPDDPAGSDRALPSQAAGKRRPSLGGRIAALLHGKVVEPLVSLIQAQARALEFYRASELGSPAARSVTAPRPQEPHLSVPQATPAPAP